MRVVVSNLADKSYDYRTYVYSVGYEVSAARFFMPRPIGDDWLQQISYIPNPSPELVRIEENIMFAVFQSDASVRAFIAWLAESAVEAEAGYNTMRG